MVAFPLSITLSEHGAVSRGICTVDDGLLRTVTEVTHIEKTTSGARADDLALTGDEPASMNLWAFKPSVLAHLQEEFNRFLQASIHEPKAEFFLPTVINTLIGTGRVEVRVLKSEGPWFGMTHREDRPRVVGLIGDLIDRGVYTADLWRSAPDGRGRPGSA